VRQHLPPTAPPAAPPQSHVDPSQRTVHGNLGINARGVQIGAQVDYADSRTNYSQCLGLAERHNWTAAHVATTCGLPRS